MKGSKILIVEDEESLLKLETILLASKGFSVSGVMDGRSALQQIADNPPDIVLLDVMLPEMDGFEVCRRIKSEPATSDIPVVILTAKKNGQDFERGREAGADAYVTKPFKSARIMEVIDNLLTRVESGKIATIRRGHS